MNGGSLAFVPPGKSSLRVIAAGPHRAHVHHARHRSRGEVQQRRRLCHGQAPCRAARSPGPNPRAAIKLRVYSLDVPVGERPLRPHLALHDLHGQFPRLAIRGRVTRPSSRRIITTTSSSVRSRSRVSSSTICAGRGRSNKNFWRADDHELCGTPSIAVIPPPSIHTTEAVGSGKNQLVDIFCPPRIDFSQKPGWVLNADDYPMP